MQIVDYIVNGGETRRFHTWPVLRDRTVAEHSFYVAMLVWTLYGREEPGVSIELLMAALTHDLAEWQFGDIPSPAKRALDNRFSMILKGDPSKGYAGFREVWNKMEEEALAEHELNWEGLLSDEQHRQLKVADNAEGALYCIRERMMGNRLIGACYYNFRKYLSEIVPPLPFEVPLEGVYKITSEQRLLRHIDDMWEQANV